MFYYNFVICDCHCIYQYMLYSLTSYTTSMVQGVMKNLESWIRWKNTLQNFKNQLPLIHLIPNFNNKMFLKKWYNQIRNQLLCLPQTIGVSYKNYMARVISLCLIINYLNSTHKTADLGNNTILSIYLNYLQKNIYKCKYK